MSTTVNDSKRHLEINATEFDGQLDGTIKTNTTATTQSAGDNSTKVATTAYADAVLPSWVPSSNPNYLTGINSGLVTTALGFTPYNATNPNNYITGYTVTQGDVTGHQAALSITESQISDLQSYLTAVPTGYATESYVQTQITNLVDSAPSALNTLDELAAALGDDANFATTITTSIGTKLPLAGGDLTGVLKITDGSAGAPAIAFTNSGSDHTGIYRSNYDTNKDNLNFAVDGSTKAYVNEAGIFSNNNVYFTGSLRKFGEWQATSGTSGQGFKFTNTADSSDALTLSSAGNAVFGGNVTVSGGTLNLGNDVSIFDDGVNILRTDDILHANNDIHVGGAGKIFDRANPSNYIELANTINISSNTDISGNLATTGETTFKPKHYAATDDLNSDTRTIFSTHSVNNATSNRPINYSSVYTLGGSTSNALQISTNEDYSESGMWIRQYNQNNASPQGTGWQNWTEVWTTNKLTATNKTNYDTAYTHSQSTHAPTNADATPSWVPSSDPSYLTSVPAQTWASITGKPSTFTPSAHNQAWSTITSTPTTISGYGITDAFDGAYGSLTGTPTIPTDFVSAASGGTFGGSLDINGNADISGTITAGTTFISDAVSATNGNPGTDNVWVSGYGVIGNRDQLYFTNHGNKIVFGVGAAHNAGNKLIISSATSAFSNNITSTGTITGTTLTGTSLDINGNADISGNLTVNGTAQLGNALSDKAIVHGHLGIGHEAYPKIAYPGQNALWGEANNSTVGQVVIDVPGTLANYDMLYMEIDIYEYNSTNATKLIIGGHNWNSNGNSGTGNLMWYNAGVKVIGGNTKPVYLGWRNDGTNNRRVIAIGDTDSTWNYPTIHVAKVHGNDGYSSSMDLIGDWAMNLTTSSSFFTKSPTTNWNASTATTFETTGIASIGGADISGNLVITGSILNNVENASLDIFGGNDTTNDAHIKLHGNANNYGSMELNYGYDATNSYFKVKQGSTENFVLQGGNATFGGTITGTGPINSTGTNKAIQVNGTTRINGVGDIIGTSYYVGSNAIIDTSRNVTAAELEGTSLDINGNADISGTLDLHDQITSYAGGALFRKKSDSWSNGTTHDVLYQGWYANTGDYVYLKAPGNSGNDHGIAFIGDDVIALGRSDVEIGNIDNNSATAPLSENWFVLNSSSATFAGSVISTDGSHTATLSHTGLTLSRSNSYIQSNADNSDTINIGQSSVRWGHVKVDGADFAVLNGGNERFKINSSGNATFAGTVTLPNSNTLTGSSGKVAFNGRVSGSTPTGTTDFTTKAYVDLQISNLIDGAPGSLDTLNELAEALNDDDDAVVTINTALGNRYTKTESDGRYLQSYTETNNLSSAVTWANVPNTNITQGSVTQHQGALSITESQISDLGSYLTSLSGAILTSGNQTSSGNKTFNGQIIANNSIYLQDGDGIYITGQTYPSLTLSGDEPTLSSAQGDTCYLSDNVRVNGDLTVNGGDITLNGTGTITGIDTVTAATHAANKSYVDTQVATRAASSHTHTFASLTSKPTTISGYGITDAFDGVYGSLSGTPTIPSGNQIIDWTANGAGTIHSSNYTNSTYNKASFDLDHLFDLVGATADTSTNMGSYTSTSVPANQTIKQNIEALSTRKENFIVACSDETSDLTTGTAKVTFRMPYAMQITEVRASVTTAAASGTITVDINLNGSSIFGNGETGTRLTIDSGERTSFTAATAYNFASSATVVVFGNDAEVSVDIDTVGSESTGKGLKVTLIGYQR